MKQYAVYIMASKSRTIYTGVTSNLEQRVYQHKNKMIEGFTSKYNVNRLVYFELTTDGLSAIEKEKQIKGWTRARKIALIETTNPTWQDLSETWNLKAHTLTSQDLSSE